MSSNRLASDDPAPEAAGAASEPVVIAGCWVFDVDACLIDSLTGTSLRPGARGLLEHLVRNRCRILLWSAGGGAYARSRAEEFGIDHLVSGYFAKDGRDANAHFLTTQLPLGDRGVVFVDDRPEDLARDGDGGGVHVLAVSPYLTDDPHDHGLLPVARRAGLVEPRDRQ